MVLITNYYYAILLTVFAMICWGSWQNTRNLIKTPWRFELFYWDFVLGIFFTSLLSAFTLGSLGEYGRVFIDDLLQADPMYMGSSMLGGMIWNLGTLLLTAAIVVAGMSVAFPIGGGIGWLLGILVNYQPEQVKNSLLLFTGMVIIMGAILFSMISYRRLAFEKKKPTLKGILLSFSAGLLIAFFYRFVANALANTYFDNAGNIVLESGKLSPYTAVFLFSVGALICTLIFNPIFMRKPIEGSPVNFKDYFKGNTSVHLLGMLAGMIWCAGNIFSFMAAKAASPAIAYGLSNAAPVVAAVWGIFVWKEFKDAPKNTYVYLTLMFICYLLGLVLITISNV